MFLEECKYIVKEKKDACVYITQEMIQRKF